MSKKLYYKGIFEGIFYHHYGSEFSIKESIQEMVRKMTIEDLIEIFNVDISDKKNCFENYENGLINNQDLADIQEQDKIVINCKIFVPHEKN